MKPQILVVEDEKRVAGLLSDYLEQADYQVHCLYTGAGAVQWVKENKPDLILLDQMLPEKDGLMILKEIRAFSNVPVIMATAKTEEIDRLLGLEIGADDYICKPYSFREVVARVKAVLRRGNLKQDLPVYPAGIHLDESRYSVKINKEVLELTVIEFKLFQILAGNPGRIFSRDLLMDHIYPDNRIVSDRTIDSHIRKLRKKITQVYPDKDYIVSVYSAGYKFIS